MSSQIGIERGHKNLKMADKEQYELEELVMHHGLLMGGRNNTPSSATTHDTIQYITIASTGDAIDFGDLTRAQRFGTGTSNGTRAVQMGGANPGAQSNIDFVEIATLGNATSFGALSSTRHSAAAESDSHGGIG